MDVRKISSILVVSALASSFPIQTWAAEAPDHYRDFSLNRTGKRLTDDQAKAFKKLIEASECVFNTEPIMARFKYHPYIVKVASACENSSEPMYECFGFIFCMNHFSPFFIDHATCWSPDGGHCPSAKDCALATYFNSTFTTWKTKFPVFQEEQSPEVTK